MDLIVWLILGALAGWLAGRIMKGGGFGLIGNIIVGIVGSAIGGYLFGGMIGQGAVGSFITAVLGAIVLLFIVSLIRR